MPGSDKLMQLRVQFGDQYSHYIAPGHDSGVVGQEPYVSLHLIGASDYASQKRS